MICNLQVDAVLRNDFDRMTYTTYHENYYSEKRKANVSGWYDRENPPQAEQHPRFIRRRLIHRSDPKVLFFLQYVSALHVYSCCDHTLRPL